MNARVEPARPSDPWGRTLDDFHSADPTMERCFDLARLAVRTDLPILIVGESGTGKTLLAPPSTTPPSARAARSWASTPPR